MSDPRFGPEWLRALNRARALLFGQEDGERAPTTSSGLVKGEKNRLDVADELNAVQQEATKMHTALYEVTKQAGSDVSGATWGHVSPAEAISAVIDLRTDYDEALDVMPHGTTISGARRIAELEIALENAYDLAEEGWGYASPYFRDKWDATDRLKKVFEELPMDVQARYGTEEPEG
jgi:hypothetical protein